MRYIRPKSLTWWSGVFAIATGVASLAAPTLDVLGEIARLITMFAGSSDTSPAGLIFLGAGLIGLGDKFERAFGPQQKDGK